MSPPSLTKKFTILKNGCPKVSLSLVQQKLNLEKIVSPTPLYLTLINLVYRNIYNVVIRNAKKLHYERELRAAQSNLKKTWSILKNAINKPTTKSSNIESLNIDGVTVNDPIVLANALNEFFSKVAIQIAEDIHPVSPHQYDDDANDDIPLLKFNEDPVTPSEILEALDSLQAKTSQDFNGLSMFLVKKLSYQLAKPLCHLFNLSFMQGVQ